VGEAATDIYVGACRPLLVFQRISRITAAPLERVARIEKIQRKTSINDLCRSQKSSTLTKEGQRMFCRVILGLLCAISLAAEAGAAALIEETLRNGHVIQHLTGRIDSKEDAALFEAAVGKLTAAGKRIDVVSPNSTGGQLGEGALIAGAIKARGLATRVEDGAVCASACFLAFAAGDPRTAHPNSYIGVHKAADSDGRET
jgi:hypothetical protein